MATASKYYGQKSARITLKFSNFTAKLLFVLPFFHPFFIFQDRNNINDPQKKHCLGTVSKNILLEGLNMFNGEPASPLVQMWIKTHRCLVCMKDP